MNIHTTYWETIDPHYIRILDEGDAYAKAAEGLPVIQWYTRESYRAGDFALSYAVVSHNAAYVTKFTNMRIYV